ncbi:hypothetical protein GOV09_00175 [Candidatus Woesearchaeota archaeon]|nr:hypothetical protein [Candidatus Woesearchaeota archaeon]
MKVSQAKHPLFNCGKRDCPICAKAYSRLRIKERITKESFSTDAVAPFIGRYGYPEVNIGLLAPPEEDKEAWLYDAPKEWSAKQFEIPQIIDYRSALINSRTKGNVKQTSRFLALNQEVSMSSKPVQVEIDLKGKPRFWMKYDSLLAPSGPSGQLKKASLTENPSIPGKVEKAFYDTDLKAAEALTTLFDSHFDENYLSRILSTGTLGIGANRKLVPTRWSITATDDTLGKHLIKEVKDYSETGFHAFFGGHLGNYYLILSFPDVWSYELIEMAVSNPYEYGTDHESYGGRTAYAENTAGGYYTVRLAILEKLRKIKRQGSFLALRFVTGDYTLPLGVWVTREAARKAMLQGTEFASKELMMKYVQTLVRKKFGFDIHPILRQSKLLKNQQQSKLRDFFS